MTVDVNSNSVLEFIWNPWVQSGGGRRREVLNTTEQGARGGEGGNQTTHLPFCSTSISGIGKESKKRVQKGEKGYHESTTRYKEKNWLEDMTMR